MNQERIDINTATWFPDAQIPGLTPYGLDRVPGWRPLPGVVIPTSWRPTPGEPGFEDPTWRAEHKAWARELRDVARPWIHAKGNSDPAFAHAERLKCAKDPNYFGAVYGWIQDPQPLPDEEQDKPYAKFAYQCDNTNLMHDYVFRPRQQKAKIWRTKSRQLGISWDDEHFDTWFYLFQKGKIKLVSRSEPWVDNGTSTEAMIGKIKYILRQIADHTPYLLPGDLSISKLLSPPHYRHRNLVNPVSGTEILGEPTTAKVARGGTYTFGRVDEDAFIRGLDDVLTSMQGSCPRIFLASTESFDEGEAHFDGWQAAKRDMPETVREYNWHQNAYLDLEWERDLLASAKTEPQMQGIQREAFRNPFAGFGQWVYPEARDLPDVNRPYDPALPLDITMDPAGSGDDFALMAAQATADDGGVGFHVLWSYERRLPNPMRIAHIATGIWPERGDDCEGWEPDSEERHLGHVFYDAWIDGAEVRWFSDPAGDQIHSRASFLTMFRDFTGELRTREYERLKAENIAREDAGRPPLPLPVPKPIAPRFKAIKQNRLFADREYALREYLSHVTIQIGVLSASRVRECWGRASYNERSKEAVTEPKRKHDQYSHLTSCGENYSLYIRYRFVDPLDSKAVRKIQKGLGLRGVPSGFGGVAIPKGFGQHIPSGFPRPTGGRAAPPDRVAPGGWR